KCPKSTRSHTSSSTSTDCWRTRRRATQRRSPACSSPSAGNSPWRRKPIRHVQERVTPEEFTKDYVVLLAELLRNSPLKEGADRIVRHLAKHKIPMAICTGSNTKEFALKSSNHSSLLSLIPLIVLTGDDLHVKRGKPAPDGYIETIKRFDSPPSSSRHVLVLVLEDAPNGVMSGLAAGCQVVQVPTDSNPCFRMGAEIDAKITVTSII
ncbi:hypothetical protein PMAYCL1PPCAC_26369, partial [Pristionchus mayeri]